MCTETRLYPDGLHVRMQISESYNLELTWTFRFIESSVQSLGNIGMWYGVSRASHMCNNVYVGAPASCLNQMEFLLMWESDSNNLQLYAVYKYNSAKCLDLILLTLSRVYMLK